MSSGAPGSASLKVGRGELGLVTELMLPASNQKRPAISRHVGLGTQARGAIGSRILANRRMPRGITRTPIVAKLVTTRLQRRSRFGRNSRETQWDAKTSPATAATSNA